MYISIYFLQKIIKKDIYFIYLVFIFFFLLDNRGAELTQIYTSQDTTQQFLLKIFPPYCWVVFFFCGINENEAISIRKILSSSSSLLSFLYFIHFYIYYFSFWTVGWILIIIEKKEKILFTLLVSYKFLSFFSFFAFLYIFILYFFWCSVFLLDMRVFDIKILIFFLSATYSSVMCVDVYISDNIYIFLYICEMNKKRKKERKAPAFE